MKKTLIAFFSIKRFYIFVIVLIPFCFIIILPSRSLPLELHKGLFNGKRGRIFGASVNQFINTTQEDMSKITDSFHCEFTTLGCFPYVKPSRKTYSISSSDATRKFCLIECSKKSLPLYVGLARGHTCFCTSEIDNYTTFLDDKQCSSNCLGKVNETCGGKNAIQWFSMKTSCIAGKDFSAATEESRFIGCFAHRLELTYSNDALYIRIGSVSICMLYCGGKHFPLAFVNVENTVCICDRFTTTLNRSQIGSICNNKTLKIYRTFAEDERCKPLKFLSTNSSVKKAVLLSFPGSGNTWVRHMIEQATGIYTGSVYGDPDLMKSGYLGEMPEIASKFTFVIKDHLLKRDHRNLTAYHSIIFVVRNPYPAYIAEFNRLKSNAHTGLAKENDFRSKNFADSVKTGAYMTNWDTLFKLVIASKRPFQLLVYEDLLRNPIKEIRKVVEFLEETNGFEVKNLNEQLLCLSQNLQGGHKRKKNTDNFDPFTNELKRKVNSMIDTAQSLIMDLGITANFSSYKRKLT